MRRRCRQTALLLEAGLYFFFGEYSNVDEVGFQINFEFTVSAAYDEERRM